MKTELNRASELCAGFSGCDGRVPYRTPNESEWVFVRFVTHSLTLGARFSGEWVMNRHRDAKKRYKAHSLALGVP